MKSRRLWSGKCQPVFGQMAVAVLVYMSPRSGTIDTWLAAHCVLLMFVYSCALSTTSSSWPNARTRPFCFSASTLTLFPLLSACAHISISWLLKKALWDVSLLRVGIVTGVSATINCSGVTKVGVTRWGNWWCHPIFSSKKWWPFYISSRHHSYPLSLPTSFVQCSL